MFINNVFATCGISSIDKLYVECMDEDNSGVETEWDKRVLEAVMSFVAVNTAYESIKSFFCVCAALTSLTNNILNLQLA
jgi:hypothetical protein